jgi:transcription initiation factor TFIIIB Brf1 subunit/transcription initiation factor TFIIB
MKKRHCPDCKEDVEVGEETIEGEEYLYCVLCGAVIAKIDFGWKLPDKKLDNSDTDIV